jgi:hypothetical protein
LREEDLEGDLEGGLEGDLPGDFGGFEESSGWFMNKVNYYEVMIFEDLMLSKSFTSDIKITIY